MHPEYLYLLFLLPVIAIYLWKRKSVPYLRYSDKKYLAGVKKTVRSRLSFLPSFLKIVALGLIIIALARPRSSSETTETTTEGIDIIITLDVSTSMLAMDFEPNRFKASVEVAKNFISGRKNDRIGFVVFAGESYTQCPVTSDYGVLLNLIDKVKMEQIEDGTAIGDALVTATNRLMSSNAKSKVIILLTDGDNNKGEIDPETAAEAARAVGIRIYTIGVGNKKAPVPAYDFWGRKTTQMATFNIDEEMLTEIAKNTGGKFFKAQNEEKLTEIYKEIDKLEKTKIISKSYKRYSEKYTDYLFPAVIIYIVGILLSATIFRKNM